MFNFFEEEKAFFVGAAVLYVGVLIVTLINSFAGSITCFAVSGAWLCWALKMTKKNFHLWTHSYTDMGFWGMHFALTAASALIFSAVTLNSFVWLFQEFIAYINTMLQTL